MATLLFACSNPSQDPDSTSAIVPFVGSYNITTLPFTDSFATAQVMGNVKPDLYEISGIACSTTKPGALWVEQDSGNGNKIHLLDASGTLLGSWVMKGIDNRDWEDLAMGPSVSGVSYLHLADIGDNKYQNTTKYIYRFPEPDPNVPGEITQVEQLKFSYDDGINNAEAMMVDPVTRDIFIISKESQAKVYLAKFPQPVGTAFVMTRIGSLLISDVTAADISRDGKEILIKNYALLLYWRKAGNESVSELLRTTPMRAPYLPEDKGEAVCWAPDGSGYFTTSEGAGEPIMLYRRR